MAKKTKNKNIISGQDIDSLSTSNSRFDKGYIIAWVGLKSYRLPVEEILCFDKDFNGLEFDVVKKKVHEYLKVRK